MEWAPFLKLLEDEELKRIIEEKKWSSEEFNFLFIRIRIF